MSNRYLKVTFDVLSVPDSDETCKEIMAATAAQGTSIAEIIRVDGKLRNVLLTMPTTGSATALSSIQDNPGVALTSPLQPPPAQSKLGGDLKATAPEGITFTGNLPSRTAALSQAKSVISCVGESGAFDAIGSLVRMGELGDAVPTGTPDVFFDKPAVDPSIFKKLFVSIEMHTDDAGLTVDSDDIKLNGVNGAIVSLQWDTPFVFATQSIANDGENLTVYVDEDGIVYKRAHNKTIAGVTTIIQATISYADAVDNGAI